MKTLRWLIAFAVVALLLSVGAAAVSAAEGSPVGAPYVDNATHSIAPSSTTWYRFEYAGDHSQITIRLVGAHDNGLSFEVFTPTELNNWWSSNPIGASSLKENDLVWSGNAHENGTWSIAVRNENAVVTTFQLVVTGEGISFMAPTVSKPVAPNPAVSSLENADPMQAFTVDSSLQLIPAQTTLWYRFPYDGTRDQTILTLLNGAENHLRMHVHTPAQMLNWWSATPIGQGTPKDNDLVWNGNSMEAGYWYVEVINDNTTAIGFQLQLRMLQNTQRRY